MNSDEVTPSIPAEQGQEPVGPGCPPKEHQFKPGASGNPDGPPRHRTNLWVWFCKYMDLTDDERARLRDGKLTGVQQTALNLVDNATKGKGCGAERMARYIVDREEGRAVEHLVIDDRNKLSDDECEEIRQVIAGRHHDPNE